MPSVHRTKVRGTSLIELIVASALVGLIMMQLWSLVASGGRFYLKTKSQSDIQRNSLLALRWISRDMSETSDTSYRAYKRGEPGRPGISFGSPQTVSGGVSYKDGRLLWCSVLGYYIETDGTLYRQQRPLALPWISAPPVLFSGSDSPDAMAALSNPRVIARHVEDLTIVDPAPGSVGIQLHVRDTELGFGIHVRTRIEMRN